MSSGNRLDIVLGVPVRVENNDDLRGSEVDAHPASLRAQEEHSEPASRGVEVVYRLLSVLGLG